MAQSHEIFKYVGLPYNKNVGPETPNILEAAYTTGISCQGFLHITWKEFLGAHHLPAEFRSQELYEDTTFTENVTNIEPWIFGDAFLLGPTGLTDMRKLHIAIHAGVEADGIPIVIHPNFIDKAVSVWPLSKCLETERYRVLYAVKRFKEKQNG